MIGKYVIKTRNQKDEYLGYNSTTDEFYLTNSLQFADKFDSLEEALKYINVVVLEESSYKSDIYKLVLTTEYIERGNR